MTYDILGATLLSSVLMAWWCALRARRSWTNYRLVRKCPVVLATDNDLTRAPRVTWNDQHGAWPDPEGTALSVSQLRAFAAVADERARRQQQRMRTTRSVLTVIFTLASGWILTALARQYRSWEAAGFSSPADNLSLSTLVVVVLMTLTVATDSLFDPDSLEKRRSDTYRTAALRKEERSRRAAHPRAREARRASMRNLRVATPRRSRGKEGDATGIASACHARHG